MLGAIVGDIAGSTFETSNFRFESCEIFRPGSHFTDDTVLTLAQKSPGITRGFLKKTI